MYKIEADVLCKIEADVLYKIEVDVLLCRTPLCVSQRHDLMKPLCVRET